MRLRLNRRQTLVSAAGLAAAAALRPRDAAAVLALDELDPFGPPTAYYDAIRRQFNTPHDIEEIVKRLWDAFTERGEARYGHWALIYNYLWWQALPKGPDQRVRAARIGQKMAEKVTTAMPRSAAGPYWGAVFFGVEALVRGVVDSLHMIPQFRSRLDEAERRDAAYNYGSVYMALAKMYAKLPPFPMSIGSLDKAFEYLEKARPLQEKDYALWYVIYAEAEMQRAGKEAAFRALDGIETVCPSDVMTRYTYEMAMYLAGKFREAVENKTYDKYTWDPLLEPIIELRQKVFMPKRMCDRPSTAR